MKGMKVQVSIEQPVVQPPKEVVLRMDEETAGKLRYLLGRNVTIPEALIEYGHMDEENRSIVTEFMETLFYTLGESGVAERNFDS